MSTVDYTQFEAGDKKKSEASNLDKRWWLVNKSERAQAIASVVQTLAKFDSIRRVQDQMSAKLYGNISLFGVGFGNLGKLSNPTNPTGARISYNVVQSAIDTVVAKMSKNKPKPLFLTSGGDWKLQRKAKKLDKFCEGVFYENEAYRMGPEALRDALVVGDGLIQVFDHYDRVKWERTNAGELLVDWMEAFYGNPRQLHRIKAVDRAVLIDLFPGKKRAIQDTQSSSEELKGEFQNVADQVLVYESWHLPSGPKASDGMHCICLPTETLDEHEWKKNYFPFAKIPYSPRLHGFWSQGAAEQIQNIQLEINKILWLIQRSMHLAGTFKVWMKTGTKTPKEHINNDIGTIIMGDEPPQYLVPPVVPPEYYQHLRTLKDQAYEQLGVSQLSASSQKPSGLNSGKALREYNDIESDRFMTVGQSYERLFMQLGRLSVDCAKDIYERNGKYQVKVPGKKFIQTIDWKNVDLEEDEYLMKIFPVSSLPNDPAGRLQTVQEYVQAGFIDPLTARKLLDFPDLEQVENLSNAQEDWINQVLEKIVDDGEYSPPEPEMNLPLAKTLTLQYIADGHVNQLEEDRMEMLRQFNSQIDLLTQKAQAPAPQPGAPQPQAQPMAQPQSDLIPNVPGMAQPAGVA